MTGLSLELEALCASLACCTYRGDQHTHILIEERDNLAKLKKVTLKVPNGDWFSFDPDNGRGSAALMSPLLMTGKGHDHHRACACVILIRRDNGLTVVYIDLKSGNPVGYTGQFKSTRQFVRYAMGLLSEFHGHTLTLVEERYVVLYGGKSMSIKKTTTAPKVRKTQPDKPHKQEIINSGSLHLAELLDYL